MNQVVPPVETDNKKTLFVYALLCLLLLFIPKVNLLNVENETAGLRLDDLVLVGFCVGLSLSFYINNKRLSSLEVGLFWIVLSALLSFLINHLLFAMNLVPVKAKIFYVFRIVEYFLFFYIGKIASKIVSLKKVLSIFVLFNAAFMILQKFGIIGRMTELGAQEMDTYRVSGVASFPSEMGAILNVLFAYFLFSEESRLKSLLFFVSFFVMTALTGARIALGVTVLLYLLYLLKDVRRLFSLGIPLVCFSIPLVHYVLIQNDSLYERSLQLFSFNNLHILKTVWHSIDIDRDMYDAILLKKGQYDMSWWIRIQKWCYALKIYITHPECYLQGVGPGAFSAAVDGGYIRLLTENGLLGCFFYWRFFREICRQSELLKWILLSLLLNMLFFDVYLAYKVMALFFLIAGFLII